MRSVLETQTLQLDRDLFEAEKADPECDMEEPKKNRKALRGMDLKEFRIMIRMLQKCAQCGYGSGAP